MDMQSQEIDKLAEALAKAQGTMEAAKHDHTMTSDKYTFRYASLAAVHAAIRKPLSDNGLAYTQVLDFRDNNRQYLITTLMHASGQFVRSVFPLNPQQNMQSFGSALTYAKRYSIAAMVGISSEEDDDGHAASQGQRKGGNNNYSNSRTSAPTPQAGHRTSAPPPAPQAPPSNGDDKTHSEEGKPYLISHAAQTEINRLGLAHYGTKGWLAKRTELVNAVAPEAKGKLEHVTVEEGHSLLDTLRALTEPATEPDKTLQDAKAAAAEGKALLEGAEA